MASNAALVSIHPTYVEKIVSGEKRFEFRRTWASAPVDLLVIYATSPVQRIVAIAEIGRVIRASKWRLWEIARERGPGISRSDLFTYLDGKPQAVALELVRNVSVQEAIDPRRVFGKQFSPPQSFRYLKREELDLLKPYVSDYAWA
jgi:predicted transcriptional regulator